MIRVALILFPLAILYQLTAGPLYALTLPGVGKISPDLVLVATAAYSVRSRTTRQAFIPALMAGLATDALSADPFLTRTLAFSTLALVGSGTGRRGLGENALGRSAYFLAATAVGVGSMAGWLFFTGFDRLLATWEQGLLTWGYDAALGFALLGLLEPFGRRTRRREGFRRAAQGGLEWYAGV